MHGTGWDDIHLTHAYVDILGHRYVVSQYISFYDQHLGIYQLLPRPYLGFFEGGNREKWHGKNGC